MSGGVGLDNNDAATTEQNTPRGDSALAATACSFLTTRSQQEQHRGRPLMTFAIHFLHLILTDSGKDADEFEKRAHLC
ncbi:hypothetical protein Q1695_008548 [Nippostrongylus brasiliensis]|nr:hypothetical protein Q1695_008548 [Nippostrongylus brasiliensis]